MRANNGSAMVITLLLLATVGSISFAIGRLFILDLAISQVYDDSTVAYYAAESGIEEGLLRYRFNKNTEIDPGESDQHDRVTRNSLVDFSKVTDYQVTETIGLPDPTKKLYDIRMYFKEVELCNLDREDFDGTCDRDDLEDFISLPVNESMKLDISNIVNNHYDLHLRPDNGDFDEIAIEAKIITNKASNTTEPAEYKRLIISSALIGDFSSNNPSSYKEVIDNGSGYYSLDNFIQEIVGPTSIFFGNNNDDPNKSAELYLKPININNNSGDLKFMIERNNTGDDRNSSIAGLYSTIKSTGHYGNVTRTLKARIDRQSGTLYDVFDFVLYEFNIYKLGGQYGR